MILYPKYDEERSAQSDLMEETSSVGDKKEPNAEELIAEGEFLFRKAKYAESLRVFNHVISLDPSQSLAWFNRGVLLETKGDLKGAQQSFEIALDLDSSFAPAAANLAVLLDRIGDYTGATKWALTALSTFDGHPLLKAIVDKSSGAVQKSPVKDWKDVSGWGSAKKGNAPHAAIIVPPEKGKEIKFEGGPEEISSYEYSSEEVEDIMAEHGLVDQEALLKEATLHDRDTNLVLDREELENAAKTVKFIDAKIESSSISSNETNYDDLEVQVRGLIKQGDAKKAIELVAPYLGDSNNSAPLWALSGGAKAKMGELDAAIRDIQKSIELDSTSSTAHHNLGVMLKKSLRKEDALFHFKEALDLDPEYIKAANNLATTAKELGRSDLEIKGYRTILRENTSHPYRINFIKLLISMARAESEILENTDQPLTMKEGPALAKEALLHLKSENSLEESILIAEAMSLAEQQVESVKEWKKLLEHNSSESKIWLGLSKSLERMGEFEKAEKCRNKVNELETNNSDHEILSVPVEQPKVEPVVNNEFVNLELAAANLTQTSQIQQGVNENSLVEWYNKGLLLYSEDKFSEALSCYDKALSIVGNDLSMKIKIMNGRGSSLYGMKKFADSINAYHDAMQLDPSNVSGLILYNLGMAYAEMKAFPDAIKCFEQSIPRGIDDDMKSRVKDQIKICKKLAKTTN
jgi:tetratricopeptide (TPR) repeat protein